VARVTSDQLIDALASLNIGEPDNMRRVVIDLHAGHIPIVHVEHYGDERILNVVRRLEGVEIGITRSDCQPEVGRCGDVFLDRPCIREKGHSGNHAARHGDGGFAMDVEATPLPDGPWTTARREATDG
jgi:hypothetical protein